MVYSRLSNRFLCNFWFAYPFLPQAALEGHEGGFVKKTASLASLMLLEESYMACSVEEDSVIKIHGNPYKNKLKGRKVWSQLHLLHQRHQGAAMSQARRQHQHFWTKCPLLLLLSCRTSLTSQQQMRGSHNSRGSHKTSCQKMQKLPLENMAAQKSGEQAGGTA